MSVNLLGRSLLSLKDFTTVEIRYLLDLAHKLKAKKKAGIRGELLDRKNVVLIFDKASTRTRCAFEVAVWDEGGQATYLSNSQMGKKESIEDTARVLGRMYDGIEYRGYSQDLIKELTQYSGVPVWNGLTDEDHPTQALADLMTIEEHSDKKLNKIKLVYCGDARNNMARALIIASAKMGLHFVALAPTELFPPQDLINSLTPDCISSGAKIESYTLADKTRALADADVLYTDVWVSMGEEAEFKKRIELLRDYKITMDFMSATKNPRALFMHCLPSFHDIATEVGAQIHKDYGLTEMEVSDEVFRSKNSVVFDEAENRLHTAKAVMVASLCPPEKIRTSLN